MQSVQGFTGAYGGPANNAVGVQQGAYTQPQTNGTQANFAQPSAGQANLMPAVPGTQPVMR